jgi:O-antigen ligase
LFLAFISTIFSHHKPLSLEKYLFYSVAISIFLFFLQIKKKFFKTKLFIEYLLLLTFILNILVIILSFISNSRGLFQGMNLLVRSYGHNHYVAFLLLVLPLVWWHSLNKNNSYFLTNKIRIFFDIFLLISSYLLLLMSLSRWALFIGIIQFFLIFLSFKKSFSNLHKNKTVYFLIKSTILGFLSLALTFLFLSLPLPINEEHNCSLRLYRKDLCISIEQNSRFFYWRQAWLSFKNYPIFGYGLGSFEYVARRFPIINQQNSAYAHNIFLHNLAEMGVLGGGSFILFIIYVFYRAGSLALKPKNSLSKFLYLAATSSLINAMLDFDWHFFVIFSLTIVFLAFILSDSGKTNDKEELRKPSLIFLYILTFVTVLLVIADALTISWQLKKPEYWLKFTPFLNFASKAPREESVINISNYESLYSWYRYDTKFINRFLNLEGLESEREKQLYLDLAEIDPVSFIAKIEFKDRSLDEAEILLKELLKIIKSYQAFDEYYFISYQQRVNLAEQIYNLGQTAYLQGDWSRASYFYQSAYFFNPYIFFDERAVFLDDNDLDQLALFFLNFQNFSPRESGDYYHYLFLYRQVTTKLFEENQLLEFEQLVKAMLDQEADTKGYLIGHLQGSEANKENETLLQKLDWEYLF